MRFTLLTCLATLLCACAGTTPPAHTAPAVSSMEALEEPDPVASRPAQAGDSCRIIRALDGRAVCARYPRRSDAASNMTQPVPGLRPTGAAGMTLQRGSYLAIGSFAERANAERWAAFNEEFGARVQRVGAGSQSLYRVLVGPFESGSAALMRDILIAVGIEGSWPVSLCSGEDGAITGSCEPLEGHELAVADKLP